MFRIHYLNITFDTVARIKEYTENKYKKKSFVVSKFVARKSNKNAITLDNFTWLRSKNNSYYYLVLFFTFE